MAPHHRRTRRIFNEAPSQIGGRSVHDHFCVFYAGGKVMLNAHTRPPQVPKDTNVRLRSPRPQPFVPWLRRPEAQ